jgi:hypothetical protein
MQNKKVLILIIFFQSIICHLFGQVDESKIFICKFSGEVLYGDVIEFRKQKHFQSSLIIDSITIPSDEVKYYNNGINIYANIKNLIPTGNTCFIKRCNHGKVNLYSRKEIKVSVHSFTTLNGNYNSYPTIKSITNYFYNKELGDIKKVTFKNLKEDLADNLESMKYINLYKKTTSNQTTLYITGSLLVLTGILSSSNKYSNIKSPSYVPETLVMAGGAICFIYSISLNTRKPDYLFKAIEAYK